MRIFLKWYFWLPLAIIINVTSVYNFVLGLLGIFLIILVCVPKITYAATQKVNMNSLQYPTSKWMDVLMTVFAVFIIAVGFVSDYLLRANIEIFLRDTSQFAYAESFSPYLGIMGNIVMILATLLCVLETRKDHKRMRER
ncbi:hypothetical protein HB943_08120 [Listeria weihenstephanensis]|uniref:Uncharacterized protein n=1 Tax=Listeria weihenstephanensis TaxID=1006155 RepID=A0A841Z5M6_9LIST|nr:hypothetical protein [Listeria weihenstephanensis]MBC1500570.1 hypothetical protein [Listeria weihenstephanensis]